MSLAQFAPGVAISTPTAGMSLLCFFHLHVSGFLSFWGRAHTTGIKRHGTGIIEYSAPFLMLEVSNGGPKDC